MDRVKLYEDGHVGVELRGVFDIRPLQEWVEIANEILAVVGNAKADLWAVDVNDGEDCYPMADRTAADDFVKRNQGRGIRYAVIRWPGTRDGHAQLLAFSATVA